MKRKVVFGMFVSWAACVVVASAEDDLKKLEGTWRVTKAERRGKALKDGPVAVLVKGNKITLKFAEKPDAGETTTFKIDPSKKPKTIDFLDPEKPERTSRVGIYALEGDTLKLCFGRAKKDRPKEFATKAEAPFGFLIVCKRGKVEQADMLSGTFGATARDMNVSMTLGKGKVLVTFDGKIAVKGTYKTNEDKITFTDEEGPQACKGETKTGTYRWKLTGTSLRFTNVNDKCNGRTVGLTTAEWTKAKAVEPDDRRPADKKKPAAPAKTRSADLMKLQGNWVAAEGFEADMAMIFKGNNFTLKDGDRSIEGTFTIDATKTPKTMDLTITGGNAGKEVERFKGKTARAIYEVDGDKFKWCVNEPGREARPEKFARDGTRELKLLFIIFDRKQPGRANKLDGAPK